MIPISHVLQLLHIQRHRHKPDQHLDHKYMLQVFQLVCVISVQVHQLFSYHHSIGRIFISLLFTIIFYLKSIVFFFFRFLPCNSHHVRENQERARQPHIHMHRRVHTNPMRRGVVNIGTPRLDRRKYIEY